MPRLLLLRHGRAASPDGVDDIARPLTERGGDTSRRMGRYLADARLVPDLALVSPARRAQETWTLAKDALGSVPTRAEPRIYEAPPDRLLTVVKGVEPDVATLLMVGHNPGLQELARLLLGDADRHAYGAAIAKYPTAGLAVIDVPRPWRELSPRSSRLLRFVTPDSLGFGEDE